MNLARTARTAAISALMTIGTLATILSMAIGAQGCAWWQKHADPVVKPIETCAGQSVNAADFNEALADLQTKNFADLGAMGIRLGWDVVACLVDDIGAQDATLKPAGEEFKSRNAEKIKAARAPSVSLRSPGNDVPPTPPAMTSVVTTVDSTGSLTLLPMPAAPMAVVIEGTVATGPCSSDAYDASPAYPGSVCIRDGVTWDEVASVARSEDRGYRPADSPWVSAIFAAAQNPRSRYTYSGPNVGRLAAACDNTCGAGRGVAIPSGCECWVDGGRGHWESAPQ